jgi:steroid 5-alpha reductase family enzyme
MWCQWLDFSSVASTLGFWQRWLVASLQHSPRSVWPSILERFYRTGDPLAVALAVCLLLGTLCLALSIPTNNHSWVDKLWSIVPVYYAWHFTLHDKLQHPGVPLNARLLIMSAIITVWGTRLTYNFARKGGYRFNEEDYRWPYLRARIHPLLFLVFNATFVAYIQHVALLGLTTPAYLAWQNASAPLNEIDLAAAALCTFFIAFEAVADHQQWAFQSAKHAKIAARKRLTAEQARGFLTSGLFRYSRHPNFWAEQCLWWSMYLFGVAASGAWLNWTIVAPIALSAIFQGSTWLTEKISKTKYPDYGNYQRTTSRFLPLPPSSLEDAGAAAEGGVHTPRTPRTATRSGRKTRAAGTPARD